MISTNYKQVIDLRDCDDDEATEVEMQSLGNSFAWAVGVLATFCVGIIYWIC